MTGARILADILALVAGASVVAVATTVIAAICGRSSDAAVQASAHRKLFGNMTLALDAIGLAMAGTAVIVGAPIAGARIAELDKELGNVSAFVLGNSESVGVFFYGLGLALLSNGVLASSSRGKFHVNVLVGCIGIALAGLVAFAIWLPFLSGISELTMLQVPRHHALCQGNVGSR